MTDDHERSDAGTASGSGSAAGDPVGSGSAAGDPGGSGRAAPDGTDRVTMDGPVCPVPLPQHDRIVMGHGSGGKMMQDLIERLFLPPLDNPVLRMGDDAGVVSVGGAANIAVSTDSHVVAPLFFPGGDIGSLSVCGTVNDVAMKGAVPMFLTAGFVLEEGLEVEVLARVVDSMKASAAEAGVQIVAGDTKVVERGKADGIYINTAGVGPVRPGVEIGGARARPGDIVILSGTIGDHGIAVLAARGELGFETELESDVAPLHELIGNMLDASDQVHVLRDPTRGGVASALNEIARQSGVAISLDESAIPVRREVQAACEMLGFDPLYVANEGKLVAIVGAEHADRVLGAMRDHRYGADAVVVGRVEATPAGRVTMRTAFGSTRIVDVLSGEMLPRIC